MDAIDFLRLCDCAQTTRLGMADRGFPRAMGRLESKGLVAKVVDNHRWPGYKVTTHGLAVIRERLREEKTGYIKPQDRFTEDAE